MSGHLLDPPGLRLVFDKEKDVFESAAKLEAESERLRDLRDAVEPEPESEPGIDGEDVHRPAKARVERLRRLKGLHRA